MQRKGSLPEQMRCTYNSNVSADPAESVKTMLSHVYVSLLSMANLKYGHKTYMQVTTAMPCA